MVRKLAKQKEEGKKPKDNEAEEPTMEFKTKLNKWGFVHVPKRALPSLPFKLETSLTARIEGDHLTISAAAEKP